MINISKLYCGLAGQSDDLRYGQGEALDGFKPAFGGQGNSYGPVIVYNCTQRCNLRCVHCYSSSQAGLSSVDELTTLEAKQLLSQLAQVNCPVVLFSGGEPLLREDLFELLAEAGRLKLRTVISTNGTLLDLKTAEKLAALGVSYVGISIDGAEKFHDAFRQTKGGFKAALSGIKDCQKAGLRTGLRFTITKQNSDQVSTVFDIAVSTNVRRICFYHLLRTGRAKTLDDQILTAEQTRAVLDVIIERTGEFVRKGWIDEVLTVGNHADGPYLLVRMQREDNRAFHKARELLHAGGGNKIGEKIGCVGWDGSVYPDQFWRNYTLGNIKNTTFKQIWENSAETVLNKLRNKTQFADNRCLKCRWFVLCKGNFRFLCDESDDKYWLNEPACHLNNEEIKM